jgi:DNA-binding LacI/PurR family transcriptional regulator
VAEFLVAGGHRRIAHIAGWHGSSTGRDRQRGFVEALAALEGNLVAIFDGMYDREVAAKAARVLIDGPNRPDAIFVGNDHMAFAVIDVSRERNLRVADDISVVGYDDVPLAAWGAYNLTTVRQPLNRMVDATVDTLLAQINDPTRPSQKIEIDGPLILRTSARVPEGWPR